MLDEHTHTHTPLPSSAISTKIVASYFKHILFLMTESRPQARHIMEQADVSVVV